MSNETPNNSTFKGIIIYSTTGGDRLINNNTIANITIASNQASSYYATCYGIYLAGENFTVSNNNIYALKTGHINNASNSIEYFGPLSGIALMNSSGHNTVTGNKVYNLYCTNTSATVYHAMSGIFKGNYTSSSATIEKNLIYAIKSDATSGFLLRGINTI
ncbi:MAG: hypothetical protein BWY70_00959 [Bacteroidetes bacterium ADurb.Bin408]|nr:MAG: hypothetical protein BWY70_00959 [Bacteroidetes bacterium ADurb.Bin408]